MAKISPIQIQITSANCSSTIPIYQSLLFDNRYYPYGYILELNAAISISSVTDFVMPDITLDMTQDSIDNAYYQKAKTNQGKILQIWSGDNNGNLKAKLADILCWNRQPYYTENLASRLTKTANNFVICPQQSLYAQIQNWNSTGLLSSNDNINIFGFVYEVSEPM